MCKNFVFFLQHLDGSFCNRFQLQISTIQSHLRVTSFTRASIEKNKTDKKYEHRLNTIKMNYNKNLFHVGHQFS